MYFFDLTDKGKHIRNNKKKYNEFTDEGGYFEKIYNIDSSTNIIIDNNILKKKRELCNCYQYAKGLMNNLLSDFRDYTIISKCNITTWKTDYDIFLA